jgi:hypothetical protein
MMLPEFASAVVPEQKIVAYLLSFNHPDGHAKAQFFSRFGFRADQWQIFADALKQHVAAYEVATLDVTPFGTRYVIEGALVTPDGRNPGVRTVWFIAIGETIPHLVPHP